MAFPTSRRLAGLASLTVDGISYDIVSGAAYQASKVKRETLAGQTRVEGYSEMPQAGFITAVIRDNAAFPVGATFSAITNSNVQLTLASGKTVLGTGMWCTELTEVATQEATFTVKFESDDVSEVQAIAA